MHLADFRSEFRPLDCMLSSFSPVSPPYRGNTVVFDGESAFLAFGFVLVVVVWLFVFGLFCCVLGVFLCFIPHHHDVFPFLTTMTWAHRPHGVRTRAKKNWSSDLHLLLILTRTDLSLTLGSGLLLFWLVFFLCWCFGLLLPVLIVRLISRTPHLNSTR